MGKPVNINDLPADVQKHIRKQSGVRNSIPKETVIRIAAAALSSVSNLGELKAQRKGLELALRWLKVR